MFDQHPTSKQYKIKELWHDKGKGHRITLKSFCISWGQIDCSGNTVRFNEYDHAYSLVDCLKTIYGNFLI